MLGNLWRQRALQRGDVRAFFWLQLWIAGGLPIALAVGPAPIVGALAVGALYFLHVRSVAIRGLPRDPGAVVAWRRNLRLVLGGDKFTWQVGATQLLTGCSSAVEVPLLLAIGAADLVPYYAMSRIVQAAAALASRPLEAGTASLLSGNRSGWLQRVVEASALTLVLATGILIGGRTGARAWVGVMGTPTMLMVGSAVLILIATVVYRGRAIRVMTQGRGGRLLSMATVELAGKVSLAFLLVPVMGAVGLLLAAAASGVLATLVSRPGLGARA